MAWSRHVPMHQPLDAFVGFGPAAVPVERNWTCSEAAAFAAAISDAFRKSSMRMTSGSRFRTATRSPYARIVRLIMRFSVRSASINRSGGAATQSGNRSKHRSRGRRRSSQTSQATGHWLIMKPGLMSHSPRSCQKPQCSFRSSQGSSAHASAHSLNMSPPLEPHSPRAASARQFAAAFFFCSNSKMSQLAAEQRSRRSMPRPQWQTFGGVKPGTKRTSSGALVSESVSLRRGGKSDAAETTRAPGGTPAP
mmetsp:Transcript_11366/g.35003  ORF Transcript_11366/g.35003 Transcript_11366/m.35003 type:complete len:251 (+) Transcript_11366:968-1720(+)